MSVRHARLVFVLLVLALVPTVVNSYLGTTAVEGASVASLVPQTVGDFNSTPTKRRDASIRRSFDSTDWAERHYARVGGADITALVVRSFDMKKLYHHPELAVADSMEFQRGRVETLDWANTDVAVHVLEGEQQGLFAYVLLYRGESIARPLVFQFRVAPDLLLRGRRPLTLVAVTDRTHVPGRGAVADTEALQVLRALVDAVRQPAADAVAN